MQSCRKHFAWLLAAGAAFASTPAATQDLTVAMQSRLTVLDPILSASHQTRDHGYMIYDTLFALDADQVVQPQMVGEHSVSENGLEYTFTLREGLAWHDGSPVTAADAVASIRRWAERDAMGVALMTITEEIEASDDATFVVRLSQPSGILLDAFAKTSGVPLFIMPEDVAATPVTEAIADYRGSGPFVFVEEEFEPGSRVVYERNEDYVPREEEPSSLAGGKVVHFDRLVRVEMADPLTSLNALIGGEIDYLQTIPFDLMPLVQNTNVQHEILDGIGMQIGLRFNHLQAPFDDRLVRQAAIWALGQETILESQFGDPTYYSVCGAAFGCGLPYESDELAEMVIEPDTERARALLEEAGYDGTPVQLLHVTDIPGVSSVALVMAQQMREAGFNVDLQAMDFMTMLSRRNNRGPGSDGGWSIFVTTWHNTEIEDPIRSLMVAAGGAESYQGWADVPAIEDLRRDFLIAADQEERVRIAGEIQRLSYEEGVFAPLGTFVRSTGYGPHVSGVLPSPATVFWNVTLEQD